MSRRRCRCAASGTLPRTGAPHRRRRRRRRGRLFRRGKRRHLCRLERPAAHTRLLRGRERSADVDLSVGYGSGVSTTDRHEPNTDQHQATPSRPLHPSRTGRADRQVVHAQHVFVTHGHLDHCGAIVSHARMRKLSSQAPAKYFMHAGLAEGMDKVSASPRPRAARRPR